MCIHPRYLGYRHAVRIRNTYCFYTAGVIARTLLNVSWYVNCLSCFVYVCVRACVRDFFKLGDVTGWRLGPIMGLEILVLYELHLLSCNQEKQANGIMSVYTPATPQTYSYQLTGFHKNRYEHFSRSFIAFQPVIPTWCPSDHHFATTLPPRNLGSLIFAC
jgi:hypothetical protein